MPETLKPDALNSGEAICARAAAIIAAGGVVAYPTETFYGLGADATNEKAIRKIFAIKGRNFQNPLALIIADENNLIPLVREVPPAAQKLIKAFWPGALTIVFQASANVSKLLTAGTGKIGVRVSSNLIAQTITRLLGHPLTATSANFAGAAECTTAAAVLAQIGEKIDAIVGGEETPGGKGSTIIDVTGAVPIILREGLINRDLIKQSTGLPIK